VTSPVSAATGSSGKLLTKRGPSVKTPLPGSLRRHGRGELHLGILIETMRPKAFESMVSQPQGDLPHHRCTPANGRNPVMELCLRPPVGNCIREARHAQGRDAEHGNRRRRPEPSEIVVPGPVSYGFRGEFRAATRVTGNHEPLSLIPSDAAEFETRPQWRADRLRRKEPPPFLCLKGAEDGQVLHHPWPQVYKGMIVGRAQPPPDLELNVARPSRSPTIRSLALKSRPLQSPIPDDPWSAP